MWKDFMSPDIQAYFDGLVPERPAEMLEMERYAEAHHFPIIGASCGYFCYQIARMIRATSVFELGSGYGYSTAWFALAVKENGGGKVHHVVWDETLSRQARQHLTALDLEQLVGFHVGEAVESLRNASGMFDLIFNDIDKHAYPASLPVIKSKLRSGGAFIIDNILWGGKIFDHRDQSPDTNGVREFTRQITRDPDWIVSIIPLRDGMILAYKR